MLFNLISLINMVSCRPSFFVATCRSVRFLAGCRLLLSMAICGWWQVVACGNLPLYVKLQRIQRYATNTKKNLRSTLKKKHASNIKKNMRITLRNSTEESLKVVVFYFRPKYAPFMCLFFVCCFMERIFLV